MEMVVSVDQIGSGLRFDASNPKGSKNEVDVEGMRPMEMLLSALASCAAFDVIHILKKQKQDLINLSVKAKGERPDVGQVKPFTSIDLIFAVYGKVDKEKTKRAVFLSVEKYCSVRSSLDPGIPIRYSIEYYEAEPGKSM